jgi:hypothetical protein
VESKATPAPKLPVAATVVAEPAEPLFGSTISEESVKPVEAAITGSVDIDLHLPESFFARFEPPKLPDSMLSEILPLPLPPAEPPRSAAANGEQALLGTAKPQGMLEVRQQAEFFMALGQNNEAIDLLESTIRNSESVNPLLYLDLLRLLRTLGRKSAYDHYRSEFNAVFSGQIAPFNDFNSQGKDLEAYPMVCQCIETLWSAPEAVDYIEKCLLRDTAVANGQEFDLEAFLDLLMLHGVARIRDASFGGNQPPFVAKRVQPGSASSPVHAEAPSLDFDLSEPAGNLIEFDTQELFPSKSPKTAGS